LLKIFKSVDGEDHDFKPILAEIIDRPANPLGKSIIYILIAVLLTAIIFLVIVEIDIFVTGNGQIIINGESKVLQSFETGTIKTINVQPGDYVEKGDVLIEIDPAENEEIIFFNSKNLQLIELDMMRLEALITDGIFYVRSSLDYPQELIILQKSLFNSQKSSVNNFTRAKELEIEQVNLQINDLKIEKSKSINETNFIRDRYNRLVQVKDIISGSELNQIKVELESKEKMFLQLSEQETIYLSKISELKKGLANYLDEFKNKLLEELSYKRSELNKLKAELQSREIRMSRYLIKAPEAGYVDKIYINTLGGVVTPAQPLLSLVPNKNNLMVKVIVRNQDIARVREGLLVKVKVDAFEYQKYGMLEGVIKTVSRDSYENENKEKVFDVYVELKKDKLNYRDKVYDVNSGMNVSAELQIG